MNAWDHYQLQEARAQKIGVGKLLGCLPADIPAWADGALRPLHAVVSLLATTAQAGTGPEGRGWALEDTIALLRHVIRYYVDWQQPPKEPFISKEWCVRMAKLEGDQEIGAGSLAGAPAKAEPAPPLTPLEAEEARQMVERVLGGRAKNYHARHLYHVALTLARYVRQLEAGEQR